MWLGIRGDYRKRLVGYVLYWELIKHACEQGHRRFHLGRSSKDSGSEQFKKKWNAESLQLYWQYILRTQDDDPLVERQQSKVQAGDPGVAEDADRARGDRRASHREKHPMSGWRSLAPAGAPIGLPDLARWCVSSLTSARAAEALAEDIRARFGVRHCRLTSTGRAGLTLLLRALRRLAPADRDEVVVPAYTCYSVAASIVKAGLKPRIVDIVPETLDFHTVELASTNFQHVLAIVATNLYGLPNDMPRLARLARQHGVFLIDDAAQAMGASTDGRWSGTWGDAGLYSLDKGKNVSAIDGGIIVTQSDELAYSLDQEMDGLPAPGPITSTAHIVMALAYFALLRPWLYAIPTRVPQLALGKTVFTTDYPLAHPDQALVALGAVMLRHLDTFTQARRSNAEALRAGLRSSSGITLITTRRGAAPAYLRCPVLLLDTAHRTATINSLVDDGIGATGSYPDCLADVPRLRPFLANPDAPVPGGRAVAQRIMTLPTHPFVTPADVARMIAITQRGARSACAA